MQPGDVVETFSDNKLLRAWIGNTQRTSLSNGIRNFINWYKDFYY